MGMIGGVGFGCEDGDAKRCRDRGMRAVEMADVTVA